EHQARIVRLRVVVQGAALQVLVAQARLDAVDRLAAEPAVGMDVAEGREDVVQPHAGAQLPGGYAGAAVGGEQKGERADQVGREAQQHAPFVTRLEHQTKIAVLEVPEAAVDQARRVRRRARTEVAFLHQGDTQAAQRRVARDAGAGDAPADDEDIHRRLAHGCEYARAISRHTTSALAR